jgi:poly(A) polymerase
VWLVGGALRDERLGLAVHDVDLAVRGPVGPLAALLASELGGAVYPVSERFATYRVVLPGGHVDLAPLRGITLDEDLRARDFTVDAMARGVEEVAGVSLIDPLGGAGDLDQRLLRACAPDALAKDPVRVIRFARLRHGLGLDPAAETERHARASAAALARVSGERLEQELTALLTLPGQDAADAVRDLHRLGALAVVLPEVAATSGVTQNPYHHRDVFEHTLEALVYVAGIVDQLGGPSWLASPDELGLADAGPLVPLAWAVLLHDIGKPAARDVDPQTGMVRFWYHDEIGAGLVGDVARRLRFSRRLEQYLTLLVRQHLRLGFLVREEPLSRRALARFRRDVQPYVFEALVLSLADRMATRGEKTSPTSIARHFKLARDVWEGLPPPIPRLLTGDDVMRLLGIPPGRAVGRALAALKEETEAGEVSSRGEAERYLTEWWEQQRKDPQESDA